MSKDLIKTLAKFVVSERTQGFLIGKNGSFTKELMDCGVYMKCYKDRHNRALKPQEAICVSRDFGTKVSHLLDL